MAVPARAPAERPQRAGFIADVIIGITTPLSRSIAWPAPNCCAALLRSLIRPPPRCSPPQASRPGCRHRESGSWYPIPCGGIEPDRRRDRHLARRGQARGVRDRRRGQRRVDPRNRRRRQAARIAPVGLVSAGFNAGLAAAAAPAVAPGDRVGQRGIGQRRGSVTAVAAAAGLVPRAGVATPGVSAGLVRPGAPAGLARPGVRAGAVSGDVRPPGAVNVLGVEAPAPVRPAVDGQVDAELRQTLATAPTSARWAGR